MPKMLTCPSVDLRTWRLFAELRRIGNNLNQVAHATNSGLPPHVGDNVKALRDLLHALLRDDLLRRRIDGLNRGGCQR